MSHYTMLSKYDNCTHLFKIKNKLKIGCCYKNNFLYFVGIFNKTIILLAPPNPPSNSRLPRLAVWSGYGTAHIQRALSMILSTWINLIHLLKKGNNQVHGKWNCSNIGHNFECLFFFSHYSIFKLCTMKLRRLTAPWCLSLTNHTYGFAIQHITV